MQFNLSEKPNNFCFLKGGIFIFVKNFSFNKNIVIGCLIHKFYSIYKKIFFCSNDKKMILSMAEDIIFFLKKFDKENIENALIPNLIIFENLDQEDLKNYIYEILTDEYDDLYFKKNKNILGLKIGYDIYKKWNTEIINKYFLFDSWYFYEEEILNDIIEKINCLDSVYRKNINNIADQIIDIFYLDIDIPIDLQI